MNLLCWFNFLKSWQVQLSLSGSCTSFHCQDHVPAVWSTSTFSEIPYPLQLPENKHKLLVLHFTNSLEMQLHAWSGSNPCGQMVPQEHEFGTKPGEWPSQPVLEQFQGVLSQGKAPALSRGVLRVAAEPLFEMWSQNHGEQIWPETQSCCRLW